MLREEITKDIIVAAMSVLNELRPGLGEKIYENALVIELCARGRTVEQQREYPAHYRTHFIGKLIPDLLVDYINITRLQVALLPSFKQSKLGWKRVVNERRSKTADKADRKSNSLSPSA